jgi:hypothetical protein
VSSVELVPIERPVSPALADRILFSRWIGPLAIVAIVAPCRLAGLAWEYAALAAIVFGFVALDRYVQLLKDRYLAVPLAQQVELMDRLESAAGWLLTPEYRRAIVHDRVRYLIHAGEAFRARAILKTVDTGKLSREEREEYVLLLARVQSMLGQFPDTLATLDGLDLERVSDTGRIEYLLERAAARAGLARFEDALADLERVPAADAISADQAASRRTTEAFIRCEQDRDARAALDLSWKVLQQPDGRYRAGAAELVHHAYLIVAANGDRAAAQQLLDRVEPEMKSLPDPDHGLAHYVRARCLREQERPADARKSLLAAQKRAGYAWLAPRLDKLAGQLGEPVAAPPAPPGPKGERGAGQAR